MADLVLLRELIRLPCNSGLRNDDINRVFRRVHRAHLSECVVTSAAARSSPVAIALFFNLIGIKSINACLRAAKNAHSLSIMHIRRLGTLLHLDVSPARFEEFRDKMGLAYLSRYTTSPTLVIPERTTDDGDLTRTTSRITGQVYVSPPRFTTGSQSVKSRFLPSSPSPKLRLTSQSFAQKVRNASATHRIASDHRPTVTPKRIQPASRFSTRQELR